MDPIAPADPRLLGLHDWLRRQLPAPFTVRPASNDASFRRYFRVRSEDRSWIAMDAPPEREPVGPFLAVARVLRGLELNAPRIHAADVARGYLCSTTSAAPATWMRWARTTSTHSTATPWPRSPHCRRRTYRATCGPTTAR